MARDRDRHPRINHRNKRRLQMQFLELAAASSLSLSFGMALIGFLYPVALLIVGGYQGHYSVSCFYHVTGSPHDIFVGSECAIGVFLIFFQGFSRLENWILNVAGFAAISFALNPVSQQNCTVGWGAGNLLSLHTISAIVYFVCVAIMTLFLAKRRIWYISDPGTRGMLRFFYNAAVFVMIAVPIGLVLAHVISPNWATHWIFWIECWIGWAFSLFWLIKTYEYWLLLGIARKSLTYV